MSCEIYSASHRSQKRDVGVVLGRWCRDIQDQEQEMRSGQGNAEVVSCPSRVDFGLGERGILVRLMIGERPQ